MGRAFRAEAAGISPRRREAEDCEVDAGVGRKRSEYSYGERRERQPGVSLEAAVRAWRVAATQVEAERGSGASDGRSRTGSAEDGRVFDTGLSAAVRGQRFRLAVDMLLRESQAGN